MQNTEGKVLSSDNQSTGQDFPLLHDDHLHTWCVPHDPGQDFIERCKAVLSTKEKERAAFFKFEYVRNNYIISQGALRLLLGSYTGVSPTDVQIGSRRKGKPYSVDHPELYFNISNSGNLCVYALTRTGEVGIDIENIRPLPDIDELIQKNFTSNETTYINKDEAERLSRFFRLWTIKESYLKAIGEGMRLTPDSLEFVIENGQVKLLSVKGVFELDDWVFSEFSPQQGYVGTLTYQGDNTHILEQEFQHLLNLKY